ncbi:Gfo/Idh/MocA family protein [Paenibacillus sp. GCM10023252]|uniref:Gfo/Idh/MocA family protein n=1 Tax=Paenibacillus sp. GCM10023252 TaxID=3252649 RepID=UPI0036171818
MSLKICTVGCGNHAALVHGPSYMKYAGEVEDTILAACCDLDEQRAQAFQQQFGFERSYTNIEVMLEEEKPDVVCIVVPEHLIKSTAIAVMQRGYPVLMEKPPGLHPQDTLEMAAVAAMARVINGVAFNRRHMPLLKRLKDEIRNHAPSEVQSIIYEFYRYGRTESTFETTAIHGIDAVRHIAGSSYREIRFTYQELPQFGERVANYYLDCQFDNGILARIHFCPCSGAVIERAVVHANDHMFLLNSPIWNGYDNQGELVHLKSGEIQTRISGLELNVGMALFETNGFYEENRSFFEHVRQGTKSADDILSGLQAVEIADCMKNRLPFYRSTRSSL